MTAPGTPGPTRRERRERQDRAGSRRRTVVIVVVILLVVAAGVAGWYFLVRDDDSSSSSSSTSSSSTTSTSTTTSTTATSTSSSTSSTSPPPPADPQAYAQALFTAWGENDRAAAAAVADQAAIDSLFANPSTEASAYTFSGCEGAAGSIYCSWTRPGGQLTMTVRDATGGEPVQVVEVTVGAG